MPEAIRMTSTLLGLYAGILGAVHGYFEWMQGAAAPSEVTIYAMGDPCVAGTVWHDCLPAITLLPAFRAAGIATLIFSTAIILWALFGLHRQRSGWIMILLAVAMFVSGGGFVALFVGIVAGFSATRLHNPLRLPRIFAAFWPAILVIYIIWIPAQWLLGYFYNETLLQFTGMAFMFDIALLLLTAISAVAHDFQRKTDAQPAISG